MTIRLLPITLLTISAIGLASPGPYVHCHEAKSELFTDLRGADFANDPDLGIPTGVSGNIHAGWRQMGAAAYHEFNTKSYTTIINGPTVNLVLKDESNKKYLGVRLEDGLISAKGILSDSPPDAFDSFNWPMHCDVQP